MTQSTQAFIAPKNQLNVREINVQTGEIIREYPYNGYFDISKRKNLHKVAYLVKNGKNIFMNGVHINEIRKVLTKVADIDVNQVDDSAFTDIERTALRLSDTFIKYQKQIDKINIVKDIQKVCHLAKEYVQLKERVPKAEIHKAEENPDELADSVVSLMEKFNKK